MVELALGMNPQSELKLKHEVLDIVKNGETSTIKTNKGDFEAEYLVFCAGLQADRLAKKDGVKLKEKSLVSEVIIMN
jgi:(S)-2-hydroxyglutarate dehydrogenase